MDVAYERLPDQMRQIIQDLSSGATTLVELPRPVVPPGGVLIQTRSSLLSAGTERMLVDFGRAGLIAKARKQPERVRQVFDKMRSDGVVQTLEAVRSKLEQPIPLGYCNAGVVLEVGSEVRGLQVGQRVASNGPHAELVAVPQHLCARVPDNVSDEAAAFTVVGSIALQGIRLAEPTLGECFVVTGLGLIGLITVQLLRAHGCRVLGIDFDATKLELAKSFGASVVRADDAASVLAAAEEFSRGRGVDAVLLTAATSSNDPVRQAAHMCRKRGRIVLVGVVGLELDRSDFYEKELTFQVSCSYGPGRHDPDYEQKGRDYPVGFVRWTEQRNFEAVLDLLEVGDLSVGSLVSHRFTLDQMADAYRVLTSDEPSLGIVLEYDEGSALNSSAVVVAGAETKSRVPRSTEGVKEPVVGFIGSGNYAGRVLIPAFGKTGATLRALANQGGIGAAHYAKKHGFDLITSDPSSLFQDDQVHAVVVATRHDSHADYVCQALVAGKHVFCEKPLCITEDELSRTQEVWRLAASSQDRPVLMVGFNRRYSPHVVRLKSLLDGVAGPKAFVYTINAGRIPREHWTQDPAVGGGRIIGEACHFIDLLRFLASAAITRVTSSFMRSETGDTVTLGLEFADGSIGSVHYLANAHGSVPKERVEVHADGRSLLLDNFRSLVGHGWAGFRKDRLWKQDKGQERCVAAFMGAIRTGAGEPIPVEEIFEVARITIEATGAWRR